MNIILNKNLKNDSNQPIVFELGQITTTLQDLLDESQIVISGVQTIILSIQDVDDNNHKYLLPLNYYGSGIYGLGKNVLESDLIEIFSEGGIGSEATLQSVLTANNEADDLTIVLNGTNPADLQQVEIRPDQISISGMAAENQTVIIPGSAVFTDNVNVEAFQIQPDSISFSNSSNTTTIFPDKATGTGVYILPDIANATETIASQEWVLAQLALL